MEHFSKNRERLFTYYGINGKNDTKEVNDQGSKNKLKQDSTLAAIDKINQNRENRRKKMEEKRQQKIKRAIDNQEQGIKCDVDFQLMVEAERAKVKQGSSHKIPDLSKINVWVRKRPLFQKEAENGKIDVVSWTNPAIIVHKWKFKIDGITKYVDNDGFEFDNAFSETESSDSVYYASIQPQIDFLFDGGIVTCFAYGQTGSGKTYTMEGVQKLAVNDFFAGAEIMKEETGRLFTFTVSYFEIYNGKVFDLLDNHTQKKVQEDRFGIIQIPGLKEVQARTADEMTQLIEYGLSERKTKSTAWNDTSSRSHAIGTISIKEINKRNQVIAESGKLLLVDLAGSEKAQDSQSNIKQRRVEGAEINTSLLSLKEWIRAMESNKKHVPFRQSKLTMVLRDSFIGGKNKTHVIMIAWISPDHSSAEHTLNTLRYAERLKENSDDEIILEKYVSSKAIANYDNYEDSVANQKMRKVSEDFHKTYQDPKLYQSHDFSAQLESRLYNELDNFHNNEIEFSSEFREVLAEDHKKPKENIRPDRQEFNDSMNLIEYNQGVTKTYIQTEQPQLDNRNVSHYIEQELPKTYENKPKDYPQRNVAVYSQPKVVDDQNRYKRSYEKEYQSYKRIYSEQEIDQEDKLMEIESDGSEEHHSPQMYVSSNKESSFKKQLSGNYKNSNIHGIETKSTLVHSSSSNRLRYKVDIKSNPLSYSKDKTTSSTSHIMGTYQRYKPSTHAEKIIERPPSELNKTSYDYSWRSKPLSKTHGYNVRPGERRRYENHLNRAIDPKRYNAYFRPEQERPNTANLSNRYDDRS